MMRRILLLGFVSLSAIPSVWAQDYDDIYYDSSKAKKVTAQTSKQKYANEECYSSGIVNYRDVDEYNRRGNYSAAQDTLVYDTLQSNQDFQYTDRIKRFYNPSVIVESGDSDAATLYVYTRPSVNIVVGTPSYYYSPWSSFSWGYYDFGFYDPWWGWRDPWVYGGYCYYSPWRFSHWHDPFWGWYDPCPPRPYYGGGWSYRPSVRPDIYPGASSGSRRPVGVGRNDGGVHFGSNRVNGGNRIGNIVGGRGPVGGNQVSPSDGATYRGGNIRFGSSPANNGGSYRRPGGNVNRGNNSSYERRNSYETNRSESSRNSYNNSSSSGFSRGGGFSNGGFSGGRMGGSSSNGARGSGHRR